MSAHGSRATSRHPKPKGVIRERFVVGHIAIEVIDHPENGATYGLRAAVELVDGKTPPLLFSGHIECGMGTQLRRLAHRMDELEAALVEKVDP